MKNYSQYVRRGTREERNSLIAHLFKALTLKDCLTKDIRFSAFPRLVFYERLVWPMTL